MGETWYNQPEGAMWTEISSISVAAGVISSSGTRNDDRCLSGFVFGPAILIIWWSISSSTPSNVRGGHPENVTTGWPKSWTQAIVDSPSPCLSLEFMFCPLSYSGSHFQEFSIERARCWDHLDWICDPIPLRPLYKLLIFWSAGAEI